MNIAPTNSSIIATSSQNENSKIETKDIFLYICSFISDDIKTIYKLGLVNKNFLDLTCNLLLPYPRLTSSSIFRLKKQLNQVVTKIISKRTQKTSRYAINVIEKHYRVGVKIDKSSYTISNPRAFYSETDSNQIITDHFHITEIISSNYDNGCFCILPKHSYEVFGFKVKFHGLEVENPIVSIIKKIISKRLSAELDNLDNTLGLYQVAEMISIYTKGDFTFIGR